MGESGEIRSGSDGYFGNRSNLLVLYLKPYTAIVVYVLGLAHLEF